MLSVQLHALLAARQPRFNTLHRLAVCSDIARGLEKKGCKIVHLTGNFARASPA